VPFKSKRECDLISCDFVFSLGRL